MCLTSFFQRFKTGVAAVALMGATLSQAAVQLLINPGDQGEQSRFGVYSAWKDAAESALRREKLGPVQVQLSTDATADLGLTRSRIPDIFIAPAHVIGSAVRFGYTPVLGFDKQVQAVLVVPKDSAITNLASAQGKRLGLPLQDSVVTYLLRGEVNAANTTLKRHFASLYETRYQDALLPCLQLLRCDAVAVERTVAERWLTAGQPLKIVMETRATPALSVALKDGVKPGPQLLREALVEALGQAAGGSALANNGAPMALAKKDFDYVSTLGYFTPRSLPGVALVEAQEVMQLMQAGATYVDTRTEAEFKAGHAKGALWLPYVEKSHKEADFNPQQDQFDLTRLSANKGAALIFACNGAECWKSFKASSVAKAAGYARVYWFRGGFPEWRSASLPVASAS